MKLEIGNKILEVEIINAPRGSFLYDLENGYVFFDVMYAMHSQGKGRAKIYPVWFDEEGCCSVDKGISVSSDIDVFPLKELVESNALGMQISLSESAEEMVFDFLQHDTPFTLEAAKYAMEVLSKDSPVRNAIALKTGLDGVR